MYLCRLPCVTKLRCTTTSLDMMLRFFALLTSFCNTSSIFDACFFLENFILATASVRDMPRTWAATKLSFHGLTLMSFIVCFTTWDVQVLYHTQVQTREGSTTSKFHNCSPEARRLRLTLVSDDAFAASLLETVHVSYAL